LDIRDEGVSGAVVRLVTAEFTQIVVEGNRLKAGGGATLSAIVAEATTHQLAGLETLVGIVATLGGALRCNAGDRSGEIADHVTRIEVLDDAGKVQIRNRSEIHFGDQTSDIEDPVVLSVEFALEKDRPEAIVKRMRRAWINRKATQPFSFQSAARMFKNPRGYQASTLIDQAGLARTKVGAAEVSERNANFVIAHPGTTATDVIRLLEVVQKKVHEASGVHLERELNVW
jgi:UDP-N-acetylmuramate dehydrogenase